MNCLVEFVDTSTGEIVYTKKVSYAFNNESRDTGFFKLLDFLRHGVQATRANGVPYQVRFFFHDAESDASLPFQSTLNFDNSYEVIKF